MYLDVGNAITLLRSLGFKIFLFSNQAVVARGIISYEEMVSLNSEILKLVLEQNPLAVFDDVFICPHHPNANLEVYRIDCECRKPKAGMLQEAKLKHGIDLSQSVVIGDRPTDVYAGKSVGCRGFQILTGQEHGPLIETTLSLNSSWLIPDHKFTNLLEAAIFIRDSL